MGRRRRLAELRPRNAALAGMRLPSRSPPHPRSQKQSERKKERGGEATAAAPRSSSQHGSGAPLHLTSAPAPAAAPWRGERPAQQIKRRREVESAEAPRPTTRGRNAEAAGVAAPPFADREKRGGGWDGGCSAFRGAHPCRHEPALRPGVGAPRAQWVTRAWRTQQPQVEPAFVPARVDAVERACSPHAAPPFQEKKSGQGGEHGGCGASMAESPSRDHGRPNLRLSNPAALAWKAPVQPEEEEAQV